MAAAMLFGHARLCAPVLGQEESAPSAHESTRSADVNDGPTSAHPAPAGWPRTASPEDVATATEGGVVVPAGALTCQANGRRGAGQTRASARTEVTPYEVTTVAEGPHEGAAAEAAAPEAGPHTEPASPEGAEVPTAQPAATEPAESADTWPRELNKDEVSITAENVYYHEGITGAQGNVVVKYRDLVVHADVGELDKDRIWGEFRGNVVIETPNVRTTATRLRVNLDTGEWSVEGGATTIQPQFFQAGIVEPVYVGGSATEAEKEGGPIHVRDGYATTCDLPKRHYALTSRRITVLPDDKVVLRKPTLEVFGHRALRYPWDLVLSMRRRQNRFLPTVGQNQVEGYYAKFAYLYLAGDYGDGLVRLHLTQKRGIGFGAEHEFDSALQSGQLSLFLEPEMGAFSGRARHTYHFNEALGSDLSLSLQRNSGYAGASTMMSGNMSLRHSVSSSDTSLGFEHSRADSAYSDSRRYTMNFSHRQRLGFDAGWNLQSVWRESSYGGDRPSYGSFESDFEYQERRTHLDWALSAEKRWDLSDEEAGATGYGLDSLPEIVLNTDSSRLNGFEIFGRVPLRSTLRAGHFIQYPDEKHVSMVSIDTNLGGGTTRLGSHSQLRTSGSFSQAFYDEGSARYTDGLSASLESEFGSHWHNRLSYGFGAVHGYSPLRRDYGYRRHDLSVQLVRQALNRSRVELSSGYDFVDDRYREARLRATFDTSARTRWEVMGGYDIEGSIWRPLQLRWMYARPDKLYLTMSSRYDLDAGDLSSADLELDWRAHRFWRLEAISSYSGYTNDLDHLNLRVTRDLHCWIGSLTYNKDLDEFRLGFGLKAFPFEERDWSLGRGGQRLGSYQQPYY